MKFRLNRYRQQVKLAAQAVKTWHRQVGISLLLAVSCSVASASAAERVTLHLGPLQSSVSVSDLERFAHTGQLSPALRPYRLLLTPQVQQMLQRNLPVDPVVAHSFFEELRRSPDGNQLFQQLSVALPGTTTEKIQETLTNAAQHNKHLSALSLLRDYPAEDLAVNLVASAGMAIQFNAFTFHNKILGPKLRNSLAVENPLQSSVETTAPGDEAVFKRTVIMRDQRRQRTIPVDFYYSFQSHGPLIVLSHGFAADRKFLTYLARYLASHGLTVAAVEHPGSNITSLVEVSAGVSPHNFLPASEFVDRPKDITFLLNELERIVRTRGYLKSKFNTQQVVVIGHSFGGYTALALAGAELKPKELRAFCQRLSPLGRAPADWLQCAAAELPYETIKLQDRRVKRIIALNPIVGYLFGQAGLARANLPALILSSSEDSITPLVAHQLKPFEKLPGEKYLLSVIGGTHMSVTDLGNSDSLVARNTLVKELMGAEAEPIRQVVQNASLAFVYQLADEERYQSFLTPAYVQSLSNDTVSLRLTKELPANMKAWLKVLNFGTQQLTLRQPKKEPKVPLLIEQLKNSASTARAILPQPQACIGQLDRIFTSLLIDYNRHSGRLG
ncbi:MAG: alpha/beta hydrolase [Cyanophyceae cyanobacterium]